jgi:hypothetical protein
MPSCCVWMKNRRGRYWTGHSPFGRFAPVCRNKGQRLRTARNDFEIRRTGHRDRQSNRQVSPPSPPPGIPEVHAVRGCGTSTGCRRDTSGTGKLRNAQNAQRRTLVRPSSAIPVPLHADERIGGQPDRALVCRNHPEAYSPRIIHQRTQSRKGNTGFLTTSLPAPRTPIAVTQVPRFADRHSLQIRSIQAARLAFLTGRYSSPVVSNRCNNTACFRATATTALFFAFFPGRPASNPIASNHYPARADPECNAHKSPGFFATANRRTY